MSTDNDHPPDPAWESSWVAALDELELDVSRAEALLTAGDHQAEPVPVRADWVAPELGGPIPPQLRLRAQAIATRQLQVAERLSRAMAQARQELALAERIEAETHDRHQPLFIDASC